MIKINDLELSIVELNSEEQTGIRGGFAFPDLFTPTAKSIVNPQGIVILDYDSDSGEFNKSPKA